MTSNRSQSVKESLYLMIRAIPLPEITTTLKTGCFFLPSVKWLFGERILALAETSVFDTPKIISLNQL